MYWSPLGDTGTNCCLDGSDNMLKQKLSQLEITLLCVRGSREDRPPEIDTYAEREWRGLVYAEPDFPNLWFAKGGEICRFGTKRP